VANHRQKRPVMKKRGGNIHQEILVGRREKEPLNAGEKEKKTITPPDNYEGE